jgi:hypothetical protein
VAVTAGRMARFPGMAVTTGRHGLNGSDGRADDVVFGRDGDGVGCRRGGGGMVLMAEEERDGEVWANDIVPGRGDGVEAVRVAVAWTRHRFRGRGKFWQPDGIQVKILWLGFKDRAARGFTGGQQ